MMNSNSWSDDYMAPRIKTLVKVAQLLTNQRGEYEYDSSIFGDWCNYSFQPFEQVSYHDDRTKAHKQ